jgi:protein-tyrosine phosphatase
VPPAITKVEAHGAPDGLIEVSWELTGDADVDLGIGRTPVALEHAHVARVTAGTTRASVPAGPGERHYVSVVPVGSADVVVVGDRRLAFEGVTNFRDLGGYRTAQGRWARWGRVYRSDGLHRFTATDLEIFNRMGIKVVYDLRGSAERSMYPDPVASVPVPLWDETGAAPTFLLARTAHDAEQALHTIYLGMLGKSGPLFGRLLGHLAEPEGLPAVFHCHGGKDRTGMAAALLLSVLGVDRESVLDDYELTGRWRNAEHEPELVKIMMKLGLTQEAVTGFLGSPRWAMAGALSWLDAEHGSVEGYLRGPGGMDAATLEALREGLVG